MWSWQPNEQLRKGSWVFAVFDKGRSATVSFASLLFLNYFRFMLKTYETFFYMYILKYFNTNMDYIFYENLEMIALLREESPSFIISKIICEA